MPKPTVQTEGTVVQTQQRGFLDMIRILCLASSGGLIKGANIIFRIFSIGDRTVFITEVELASKGELKFQALKAEQPDGGVRLQAIHDELKAETDWV